MAGPRVTLLSIPGFGHELVGRTGSGRLKYNGADISSVALVESQGVAFTDDPYGGSGGAAAGAETGRVPAPFERILAAHGCNTARVRVWTAGTYDLGYGLRMARRVKAAGMRLVVDLHFSDTWADPDHQAIPSSWPTTLSGLNSKIFNYTRNIVRQFEAHHTPIDILQVGNEINNGFLWPVGQIYVNGIQPVSHLLHSAISGARAAGFRGKILIHLANGWNWNGLSSFFSTVFIPGALAPTDIDIIGVSYYPFYDPGATLDALNASLTNLAHAYGKPIVVAETDWPAVCPGVTLTEPSIPVSVSGQQIWIDDIKKVLIGLPHSLGQGIFYWEPGWIGNANLGSSCADNLLVTPWGTTRASINIFNHK